jgi:O-antigen/teichoic acid export membrane protein
MSEFGILMLIVTYKQVVNRIVNFQTWHAMVKFGSRPARLSDTGQFERLLRFCFRLDAGTAILAAITGIASVYILAGHVQWISDSQDWIAIYCIALVTNYRGFTTGVFRLFDKYSVQSAILVFASLFKLIGAIILALNDAVFLHYFALWMATDLLLNILELLISQRILHQHGFRLRLKSPSAECEQQAKGIWSFVINSNLDGLVRILRDLDTLLIATLMSVESAAIYTVAKRFSAIISMAGDTAFEVIYPESAKILVDGEHGLFKKYNYYSSLIVGIPSLAVSMVFLLYGGSIIGLIMGESFTSSGMTTAILLFAVTVYAFGHPLQSIQLNIGSITTVVMSNLASSLLYLAGLIIVYGTYGLTGVALSFLLSQLAWLAIMTNSTARLKRQHSA